MLFSEIAALRIHPDAQEDIRKVVEEMMYEVENSTTLILDENQWHVPYVIRQVNGDITYKDNDGKNLTLDEAIICSAARCARSSYANHDNSTTTYQNSPRIGKQAHRFNTNALVTIRASSKTIFEYRREI